MTESERLALVEQRLEQGEDTFADLRSGIRKVAWSGVGLFGVALGVAFYVGQVVTRAEETRDAQRGTRTQVEQTQESVSKIATEQIRLRGSVDELAKGQERIERVLASDPLGRRRPR